jgi:hypothetical protein
LWKRGLITENDPPVLSNVIVERRTELLKLLVSVLSGTMYVPIQKQTETVNPWNWVFCSYVFPNLYNLLYSLVNTVISSDIVGYKWIPYSSYLGSAEMEKYVEASL